MAAQRIGMETEQTVRDDALPHEQREAIVDMLASAGHAANGSQDKIQDIARAIEAMAIFLARNARHEHRHMANLISAHTTACPLRAGPGGALGRLYPFRWPVAVVLAAMALSPFVGPALGRWVDRNADRVIEAAP